MGRLDLLTSGQPPGSYGVELDAENGDAGAVVAATEGNLCVLQRHRVALGDIDLNVERRDSLVCDLYHQRPALLA